MNCLSSIAKLVLFASEGNAIKNDILYAQFVET